MTPSPSAGDVAKLVERLEQTPDRNALTQNTCQAQNALLREAATALESLSRDLAEAREELRILSDDYRTLGDRAAATSRDLAEARAEIERLKSDREFVVGFNHGWDEAIEQNLRFPTMLRKMWSGQEVQRWIDEEMSRARSVLSQKEAAR